MARGRPLPTHPVAVALTDPIERYRWLVGYFATEMADADYLLADVVRVLLGPGEPAERAWGQSGGQLIDIVRAQAAGERELCDLVDEYEALYRMRNQVVHGLYWGPQGTGEEYEHVVAKLERRRRGVQGPLTTEERLSDQELYQLVVRAEAFQTGILEQMQRFEARRSGS